MSPVEILYVLRMRAKTYRKKTELVPRFKQQSVEYKLNVAMAEELSKLANEIERSI